MRMKDARCLPFAVGSFPYKTTDDALNMICQYFREIPPWPQLPVIDPKEQMYNQFSESMAGLIYDPLKGKISAQPVDDPFFEEMAQTLEQAMLENYEHFAISPEYARGFYSFIENSERIKALNPCWIKGQVTGPVSFGLNITDSEMKPILYDESYREVIRNVMKMKALWQVRLLKKIHPNIIIMIDEPYLASIGSSMVAVSRGDAVDLTGELTGELHDHGVSVGVHCCGNMDWSVLFDSGCDIISVDAYGYGENLLLFRDELTAFIKKGGVVAWGIVPTSDMAFKESVDSLKGRLDALINRIAGRELSRGEIMCGSLISASCGMGNLSEELSLAIMNKTVELSGLLRKELMEQAIP